MILRLLTNIFFYDLKIAKPLILEHHIVCLTIFKLPDSLKRPVTLIQLFSLKLSGYENNKKLTKKYIYY